LLDQVSTSGHLFQINKNINAYKAVGPEYAQFISVRQVSSDAGTLRRCTCGPPLLLLLLLTVLYNLLIKN